MVSEASHFFGYLLICGMSQQVLDGNFFLKSIREITILTKNRQIEGRSAIPRQNVSKLSGIFRHL